MTVEISDPPRLKNEEIATFVTDHYGLITEVKPLVSDIGQNFHLIDSEGKEYILKIANKSESLSMLEAQNAALEYLKSKNHDFRIPELLSNLQNSKITQIVGHNGNPYNARVLSFLPGKFLADISPHTNNHMKDVGKLLGNLDKSLQDFNHPTLSRYWHWDLKNIPDIKHLTKHILNPANKRLVDYFILQFEAEVLSKSYQLRKSVIHNDANDHNILVNEENSISKIDGIIDFGDMVHSHTIFDLAIALAYIMLEKKDPLKMAFPVVKSYHQIFPLYEIELEVLFYSI
jgi:Ser/Thr protein kinase RdoA (MazF antagonist)